MNTLFTDNRIAFVVDEAVAIWLNLARCKQEGFVPPIVQRLLNEHKFDRIGIPSVREILDETDFLDLEEAYEFLSSIDFKPGMKLFRTFEGRAIYVDSQGKSTDRCEDYEAVPTIYITDWNDIRDTFSGKNVFPDGFDYLSHIAKLAGTYSN